eukprot:11975828-Ditylum_brightwellii.AAC.1
MIKDTMLDMGFTPCMADPDVWIRRVKMPCGFEHYENMLIYVDDILHIAYDTHLVMKQLIQLYELKEGSVGEPMGHLGANIEKYQLPHGHEVWSMSSCDYCAAACKQVNEMLSMEGHKL